MALLESRLNEMRMVEYERRLQSLERQKRQRGRQRPRRQRKGSRSRDNGEDPDMHNQGMYNTNTHPTDDHSRLSSQPAHQSNQSQNLLDSSQPEPTVAPTTSSPVPHGYPVPPFRSAEYADLDASDVTHSSEPSTSFLETTVLPNQFR